MGTVLEVLLSRLYYPMNCHVAIQPRTQQKAGRISLVTLLGVYSPASKRSFACSQRLILDSLSATRGAVTVPIKDITVNRYWSKSRSTVVRAFL